MPPKAINHVAIVVEDLEAALPFWQDVLGIAVQKIEEYPQEAVRTAFLPLGGSEIELVQPIEEDSGVARYLAKRGQGLHHLCLEVDDLDALMTRLHEQGVTLINDTPRSHDDGTRYAFVHPRSTQGVLLELYERPA